MNAPRIQQLSASLVNRIAAGEVIERPASVVKELVENALDAGSTVVQIEVEEGGLSVIRVIDNGRGIDPADLALAFAQHATSKLRDDEDLFKIATMGFRGEALASIGAVSHARIISRQPQAVAGYEIFNRGGEISDPQQTAGNTGTTVEVRNLFFNTPARRKFLKGASTEFGHVSEMVLRLSLAWPGTAFRLSHNGRQVLDLPAAATPTERLLRAWPEDFRDKRLLIDAGDAEIRLWGIVGVPELARPTPKYQYLFLNGRGIRDKFIQHALKEAYRGLTEPGRQPAAVLMLEMPPGDVDVNVHPTKMEVRFKDGGRVHGLVLSAIRERLLGSDLTPKAQPHAAGAPGVFPSEADQVDPDAMQPGNRSSAATPSPERLDRRQQLADFFRQGAGGLVAESAGREVDEPRLPAMSVRPEYPPQSNLPSPTAGDFSRFSRADRAIGRDPIQPAYSIAPQDDSSADVPPVSLPGSPTSGESSAATGTGSPGSISATSLPAMQLHNSYLVAETPEGMVIIDQHALHERIMFEDLMARVNRGNLESQRLLIPQTFAASPAQLDLLEQIQPLLARLGIEASSFGPSTAAVQAFPSFLERLEPARFVQELLEKGEQDQLDLHPEELLHEILDMMACKAAVKAGDPLSPQEIAALLAHRDLVDRSSNCPHGRPTTLRLSLKDLEKQFKRTGF